MKAWYSSGTYNVIGGLGSVYDALTYHANTY